MTGTEGARNTHKKEVDEQEVVRERLGIPDWIRILEGGPRSTPAPEVDLDLTSLPPEGEEALMDIVRMHIDDNNADRGMLPRHGMFVDPNRSGDGRYVNFEVKPDYSKLLAIKIAK